MRKRKNAHSAAIYLIFLTNTLYAIQHGFTWPYWVAAALTAAVLILDIAEAIRNGRH